MRTIAEEVAGRIGRFGPRPFDEVMELALYDPDRGFFASAGAAGRRGDFLTSPEVGPLFGAVLARALDRWWEGLGSPDPYVVVDAGAGAGTLARAILAAVPECACALTYILVERSDAQRSRHARGLPLVPPALALPPSTEGEDGAVLQLDAGTGPRVVSLPDLPALPFLGVVIANELLDNIPFRIVERGSGSWREILVGRDRGGFVEVATACPPELGSVADAVAGEIPEGSRIPVQLAAAEWVGRVLERLAAGRLVVLDYGATTAELAAREGGWLRTYRGHERGASPLLDLGKQDITADVAIDQIARDHVPTSIESQAEFLQFHGIEALVDAGRRVWDERAHIGDLDAIRGRSRVREAEALTDPGGLGSFLVMQWEVSRSSR